MSSSPSILFPFSRRGARSGVTLVELLVCTLLLAIVFCCWAAMNNIQGVRRESLRYAAVEKAAGILDLAAGMELKTQSQGPRFYELNESKGELEDQNGKEGDDAVRALWSGQTIGYRLWAENRGWGGGARYAWTNGTWAVICLYDTLSDADGQKPFAELRILTKRR